MTWHSRTQFSRALIQSDFCPRRQAFTTARRKLSENPAGLPPSRPGFHITVSTEVYFICVVVTLLCYNLTISTVPPCAKQTFSLGNLSKTPPNIMEQIAMVVSDGMPVRGNAQQNLHLYFWCIKYKMPQTVTIYSITAATISNNINNNNNNDDNKLLQ